MFLKCIIGQNVGFLKYKYVFLYISSTETQYETQKYGRAFRGKISESNSEFVTPFFLLLLCIPNTFLQKRYFMLYPEE
jgi:hypothetical protein